MMETIIFRSIGGRKRQQQGSKTSSSASLSQQAVTALGSQQQKDVLARNQSDSVVSLTNPTAHSSISITTGITTGITTTAQAQATSTPGKRTHHKKFGQVKLVQTHLRKYSHTTPCVLVGRTSFPLPVSLGHFSSMLVPSYDCLKKGYNTFLPSFPLSPGPAIANQKQILLVLHSVLKSALEGSSLPFQRHCKLLLLESPSYSRAIFLDEILDDVIRASEQCYQLMKQERQMTVKFELVVFYHACRFLAIQLNHPVEVLLTAEEVTPWGCLVAACSSAMGCDGTVGDLVRALTVSDYIDKSEMDPFLRSQLKALVDPSQIVTGMIGLQPPQQSDGSKYDNHLPLADITLGLQDGRFIRGVLKASRFSCQEGELQLGNGSGGRRVLISNQMDMNRAMDGDEVAIEVKPSNEWSVFRENVVLSHASGVEDPVPELGIEEEEGAGGISPARSDEEPSATLLSASHVDARIIARKRMPTAKVLGILKRTYRPIVAAVPMKPDYLTDRPRLAVALGSEKTSAVIDREEAVLVTPQDRKYPRIRIRSRQWGELQGRYVVVMIDDWTRNSDFPDGHIVRTLGDVTDWKTHIDMLLIKHSIAQKSFSLRALGCLPPVPNSIPLIGGDEIEATPQNLEAIKPMKKKPWVSSGWTIPPALLADRVDMRDNRRVFSVDPPGCQDIDDAMHVHWVSEDPGIVELGVSIADVCAFVSKDSPLDLEAQARGTTIYMTHLRMDMLPSLLSSDVASLHGQMDRLAVTVFWQIRFTHKRDGSPVRPEEDVLALYDQGELVVTLPDDIWDVARTAIHSVAAMTYEQAHRLVANQSPDEPGVGQSVPAGQAGRVIAQSLWTPIRRDLKVLTVIGRVLNTRRRTMGALDLRGSSGSELKFTLDAEGNPIEVHGKDVLEVHSTIEELMVYANEAVARLLYRASPTSALIRAHADPSIEKLKERMQSLTSELGLDLFQSEDPKCLLEDLRRFRERIPTGNDAVVGFIASQVVRCMSEALYTSSGSTSGVLDNTVGSGNSAQMLMGHFGLGLTFYTHFTSPIRRYADVMVHRQLLSLIKQPEWKSIDFSSRKVSDGLAEVLSIVPTAIIPQSLAVDDRRSLLDHKSQVLLSVGAIQGGLTAVKTDSSSSDGYFPETQQQTMSAPFNTILPPLNTDDSKLFPSLPTTSTSTSVKAQSYNELDNLLDDLLAATISDDFSASSSAVEQPIHVGQTAISKIRSISPLPITQPPAPNTSPLEDVDGGLDNLLDGILSDSNPCNEPPAANDALDDLLADLTGMSSNAVSQPCVSAATDDLLEALLGDVSTDDIKRLPGLQAKPVVNSDSATAGLDPLSVAVTLTVVTTDNSNIQLRPDESTAATPKEVIQGSSNTVDDSLEINPYTSLQVQQIADHLNIMNRRSKLLQSECQEVFLRFYYRNRTEVHHALVYSLRANGVLVYIPALDYKGALMLTLQDGRVIVDPTILSLPPDAGEPLPPQMLPIPGPDKSTTDRVTHFHSKVRVLANYSCQLWSRGIEAAAGSGDIEATELRLLKHEPKTSSTATSHVLRIQPMQRLMVEVSGMTIGNRVASLPQLRLSLLKIHEDSD